MQTHLELQVRISPLFYYYTNVFLNKDFVYDYQHGRIMTTNTDEFTGVFNFKVNFISVCQ